MITANLPPFSLMAMTGQPSYPLNSANASPPGTCRVYLSCAEMALPPKTATAAATITISKDAIFVMLIPPLRFVNEVKLFKSTPARRERRTPLKLVARETRASSDQATGIVSPALSHQYENQPEFRFP